MQKMILQRYNANSATPTVVEIPLTGDVTAPGNNNYIGDGGNDMYDDGNAIATNLHPYDDNNLANNIPYTHTQQVYSGLTNFTSDGVVADGTDYFGSGSSYFTNMYSYLFVLGAKDIAITEFTIDGYLGADSSGSVGSGQFTFTSSIEWTGFWKTITDGGTSDPKIHHLILVPGDGSSITHTVGSDTDDDDDTISGSIPSELYYLLFATDPMSSVANAAEIQDIAEAFVLLVNSSSLNTTLDNINSDYTTVTDLIPNKYEFSDDGVDLRGIRNPTAMVCLGWEADDNFRDKFIVYCGDTNSFYSIKMNSRDPADGAVVEFIKYFDQQITGMVYMDGIIYAVAGWLQALIKMDTDLNVLNESEDTKYDPALTSPIFSLFRYKNQLYGTDNSGLFNLINKTTGECTAGDVQDFEYEDFCEKGTSPPPVDVWFVTTDETHVRIRINDGETLARDVEIQWNPAGYSSYGDPPADDWTTVDGEIVEEEDGDYIEITMAVPADFSLRIRYVHPASEWFYIYWD